MRDFDTLTDHQAVREIVDVICDKTQNKNRNFFRIETVYFLAKMASSMRARIKTKDRGIIPVNLYALAFATSGFGKGYSINILEESFLSGFKKRFMGQVFPKISETHMLAIANNRAVHGNTTVSYEEKLLKKEFIQAGAYPFTFDSGTTPAVKQLRKKLLLADCGAINLQIDEIGSNIVNNEDILNTYLELYDLGKTKTKLVKNTQDNVRNQEVDGSTPANMLLFGTPTKLLDGSLTEDRFFDMLQIGYARRCVFAWGKRERASESLTAQQIYSRLTDKRHSDIIEKWYEVFYRLANSLNHKWMIVLKDEIAILLLEYKIKCESYADSLPEHCEIEKAELSHRYFKTLKLAGIYAFIDGSSVISEENLYHAIHLVEDSGKDFKQLLNREKTYVKLAKYIAAHDTELTHADMYEALPFYKQGVAARAEILTLASAWGYKNNIIIKKNQTEGIEFFSGETLEETNINKMIFTCSKDFASDYDLQNQPFEKFHMLTSAPGWNWCNHEFKNNHRRADNVILGFNMIVLDIDGTANRDFVHNMLYDYTFMTHTTKRHREVNKARRTIGPDRFRLVMPLKYKLYLDKQDYEQFMSNIVQWLPFEVDEAANQRERKWLTNSDSETHYNIQETLLDPIKFIPKTSRNESHEKKMIELKDLDKLEKWFAENMVMGNRNNYMIRFAMALYDMNMNYIQIEKKILNFNSKLNDSLSETELKNTVLKSVARKIGNQDSVSSK